MRAPFSFIGAGAAPSFDSVTPSSGYAAGGDTLVLAGHGFTGATDVRIDFVSVPFTVDSDTQITCGPTLDHALGDVPIVIILPTFTLSIGAAFTYINSSLTFTNCTPNHGDAGGTTDVTLIGTGFRGMSSIEVEPSITGVAFAVVDDETITLTVDGVALGAAGGDPIDFRLIRTISLDEIMATAAFTFDTPAPVITSLDHDLGDTLGGETVVITGTDFTGATAVTNTASFIVDSPTQITAVMAAGAAGATTIAVTTPSGTSSGAAYEYWDPSVLTPNWFGDKTLADGTTPGYVVATNGSWVARSHTTTAASRDRAAASAPTDGGGYPVFHRTNSERLDGTVAGMSIVNAWGTGDMTVLVVLNVASIEVEGTHGGGDDASNGAVIGNGDGYGALLLGGAGADEAIFHYHSGGNRSAALTLFATTGRTVLAAKKVDTSPGSADMRITQDGISWTTGDTGVGALTGGSSGQMIWGYTGYLPYFYNGSIKACVLDDTAWSDADVVKFFKWAAARHP